MMCSTCDGIGNLFNLHGQAREWWPCPACGGAGVRMLYGPAELKISKAQGAFLVPDRDEPEIGSRIQKSPKEPDDVEADHHS